MGNDPLELQIIATLESMTSKYRSLDTLSELWQESDLSTDSLDEINRRIRVELEAFAKFERESKGIFEQYRNSWPHSSDRVKQLTQNLASLMERFLMKVTAFEQKAQRSRDLLFPQIHEGVKALQMQDAYRKNA